MHRLGLQFDSPFGSLWPAARQNRCRNQGFSGFSTAHSGFSTCASKHTFLVFISLSSGPRCVLGALRLDIHLWSDSFFLHPPPPPQEDMYTKTEGFCRSPLPWTILFNYATDETCWNLKHACAQTALCSDLDSGCRQTRVGLSPPTTTGFTARG